MVCGMQALTDVRTSLVRVSLCRGELLAPLGADADTDRCADLTCSCELVQR
jgi:hypothetical protein